MKTRHLPVRHLATPLLLSLLAACGGGGANPSASLVSAPVNGTQAGGAGGNGSKPGRQRQPAGRRHVGQPRRLF